MVDVQGETGRQLVREQVGVAADPHHVAEPEHRPAVRMLAPLLEPTITERVQHCGMQPSQVDGEPVGGVLVDADHDRGAVLAGPQGEVAGLCAAALATLGAHGSACPLDPETGAGEVAPASGAWDDDASAGRPSSWRVSSGRSRSPSVYEAPLHRCSPRPSRIAQRLSESLAASFSRAPSWGQLCGSPTSPTSSMWTTRPSTSTVSRQTPPTTMLVSAGTPALARRELPCGFGATAGMSPRMVSTRSKLNGPTMPSSHSVTVEWAT